MKKWGRSNQKCKILIFHTVGLKSQKMAIAPQWIIFGEKFFAPKFLFGSGFQPYRTYPDTKFCLFSLLLRFQRHDHLNYCLSLRPESAHGSKIRGFESRLTHFYFLLKICYDSKSTKKIILWYLQNSSLASYLFDKCIFQHLPVSHW